MRRNLAEQGDGVARAFDHPHVGEQGLAHPDRHAPVVGRGGKRFGGGQQPIEPSDDAGPALESR